MWDEYESSSGVGEAYARNKNTSARLWAKKAEGAYARGRGGVFVGHYGTHLSVCMLARVSNSLLRKWLSTTLPNTSQIQRTVLSA